MELTGLSEQLMEQQVLLVSCHRISKLPGDWLEMSLLSTLHGTRNIASSARALIVFFLHSSSSAVWCPAC